MLQFGREKGRAEEPWKNNNQSPPIFDILLPFSCRNGLSLPLNIGSNHFLFSLVFFSWAPFTSCFLRVYLSISIWSFSRVTQEGAKKKSKDENTITTTTRQQNHFEPRFSDPGATTFLRFFCFSFVFLAFQFPHPNHSHPNHSPSSNTQQPPSVCTPIKHSNFVMEHKGSSSCLIILKRLALFLAGPANYISFSFLRVFSSFIFSSCQDDDDWHRI